MTLLEDILRFINLFSAALLMGGQVMVYMVILPIMRGWPPALSVRAHQGMLFGTPDRYIVPSAIVCPLSALILVAVRHNLNAATIFDLIGVVCAAGVTIASVAFAEPVSRKLLDWKDENVPAEYTDIQRRWDQIHTVRTLFALLMMAAFIIATLKA